MNPIINSIRCTMLKWWLAGEYREARIILHRIAKQEACLAKYELLKTDKIKAPIICAPDDAGKKIDGV